MDSTSLTVGKLREAIDRAAANGRLQDVESMRNADSLIDKQRATIARLTAERDELRERIAAIQVTLKPSQPRPCDCDRCTCQNQGDAERVQLGAAHDPLLADQFEHAVGLGRWSHGCDNMSAIVPDDRHFITDIAPVEPSEEGGGA